MCAYMSSGTSTPCISGRYWALPSTCSAGITPALRISLLVVDVGDEGVERPHALLEPGFELRHSCAGKMRGTMSNGMSRSVPAFSP